MAKKAVMRQCIGCGQAKEKREMIRIIRTPEGGLELDATGKKNGRGAYVCRSKECLIKAKKTKGIERSFRMVIPEEIYQQLSEELGRLEDR